MNAETLVALELLHALQHRRLDRDEEEIRDAGAVLGGVAAVIAAGYYLRLLASIWFSPPQAPPQPASGAIVLTASAAAALSFPVLVLALGAIQQWAEWAVGRSF